MVGVSPATPGTEAGDAVGGAFGPQWRSGQRRSFRQSPSNGILTIAAALAVCTTFRFPVNQALMQELETLAGQWIKVPSEAR
jgi:hypothetical protein